LGSEPERWTVSSKPTRAPNAATRVLIVAAAVLLAGVTAVVPFALGAFGDGPQQAGQPAGGRLASSVVGNAGGKPILGILGASGNYLSQEKAAGIGAISVQVSWNEIEPTQGTFSSVYMSQIQAKIAAVRSAGMSVVLDPGLQYPPDWVFLLPGGTRFVNQYGDVFGGSGPSGNDVANGFTDLAVRAAEGTYLAWLGSQINPGQIIAIRQGGGPLGELRYPLPDDNGHTNSYWAYDASTQAALPPSVQGWTPGTGTAAQAQTFLTAYNQNIVNYGVWLNGQLQNDFNTKELVLLPGWGERPEGAATVVAALLQPAESMDEFNEGLDWTDLLGSLPDQSNSVAYTTYLDGATVLPTLQLEDPADYIASLAAGTSIRLGGENTGNGSVAAMHLCIDRAVALGYWIVNWNDEAQLIASGSGQDPGGPTLAELGASLNSPQPVTPPLSVTTGSLASAMQGQTYSAALNATSGAPLYTWSVSSGALPPGLSLSAASGVISGVPTASGRFAFTATVRDSVGYSASANLSITVSAGDSPSPLSQPIVGIAATPDGGGYWVADSHGGVEPFGDAVYFGSMAGQPINQPVNHIVATPDGGGYWLVAADGGTFAFGDAHFYGSMGGQHLNAPVVDIAPATDGRGYWLVASDGGIFSFGDATFHGSMGGARLNQPVVGIAPDPRTGGYWEVATDGGIFAFDSPFYGSTGGIVLNKPVNGMAVSPDGDGYWFVASDGGIFSFGDAVFHGSVGGMTINAPVVGMAADSVSGGYWLVSADGGVFSGGAPFYGAA
jgi:Putative Ig domain